MSTRYHLVHAAAAFAACAGLTFAQTGPWADGELLVRAPQPGTNQNALFRIDPVTGHGVELLSGFSDGTFWGRLAFDSYRGGFVTNLSLASELPGAYKIRLLRHDGSTEHLPGFEGKYLDAFCATGDGRIFFQEHSMTGSGPWYIRWLDANGASHTLLDAAGLPFDCQLEHIVYHAPSNSLIGTTSPWWSTHHCVASGPSAFRLPLTADGTKLAGAIECASFASSFHDVMSMDWLPNGKLLLTMATGAFGPTHRLGELDPVTLAYSTWADPLPLDLNGGLWCDALGKAVVLMDAPDQLRAYSAGQNGMGALVATDVVLENGSSGFSPGESIWETKVTTGDGNYCVAHVNSTGKGANMSFSGSKSFAQNDLTLSASPVPNNPYLFLYGPAKASLPFGNGTLCVGGGIHRIPPPQSATANVASVTPDLVALGIGPGVWQFQCWFRDTAAGGAFFDLSDATQVTIVP
jgi:hypothetical protein